MVKLPKLKLPIPKKPIIKGVSNPMLLGSLVIGGAIVYYYMNKGGFTWGESGGAEGTGNRIKFTVSPQVVQPNSTIQIQGQVLGPDGQGFRASKIYYYIYRIQPDNTTLFYVSGTAGEFTSEFTKVISTQNYPDGNYLIAVSDAVLTAPPQVLPGTTPVGGQNPPVEGQNTIDYPVVNDIGDNLTLA